MCEDYLTTTSGERKERIRNAKDLESSFMNAGEHLIGGTLATYQDRITSVSAGFFGLGKFTILPKITTTTKTIDYLYTTTI